MISSVVQKLSHHISICVSDPFHNQHKQMQKLSFHSLALVSCSLMLSHSVQTDGKNLSRSSLCDHENCQG